MDHNISNPLPADSAVRSPLPQHTVELTPPRLVKRKGSVADMLMRLTAHTASSRGKARDARDARAEQRSLSSPQRPLRPSQSMRSLTAPAAASPRRAAHARTRSNPAHMPPISRPIAMPVGFSPAPGRGAGVRTPPLRQRPSFSSSLLSDSSGASSRSADSPDLGANASKVSLGTPRRPAPLPPSQATAAQPRTRRGPGALASPPRNPASRKPAPPKPAAKTPPAAAGSPQPSIEPLAVAKTRRTPKQPQTGTARATPEYVKRSPRLPDGDKPGPVGLGLDLGTTPVRKRVASAPAPPAGYTATKPRSMSHILPPLLPQPQTEQAQVPPERQRDASPQEAPARAPLQAPKQRQRSPAQSPPNQARSQPQQPQPQQQQQQQQQNQPHLQQQQQRQPSHQQHPQMQSPRAVSRSQQMRERLAELQTMTRQPADARPAGPRTPVMQQTGFSASPSPGIASLNQPRTNGVAARSPSQEPPEVFVLKQKLSRLEVRYNVLKEQREQDALNLQSVSGELNTVQASRDSLLQQVSAYEHAQQDMQRRLDSLQKNLVRSQRLLRVLGANLEDSKVALEEKNMENYALKRCLSRTARSKLMSGATELHNDGGMLSPPSSISDAGEVDQDSDTPTIRE